MFTTRALDGVPEIHPRRAERNRRQVNLNARVEKLILHENHVLLGMSDTDFRAEYNNLDSKLLGIANDRHDYEVYPVAYGANIGRLMSHLVIRGYRGRVRLNPSTIRHTPEKTTARTSVLIGEFSVLPEGIASSNSKDYCQLSIEELIWILICEPEWLAVNKAIRAPGSFHCENPERHPVIRIARDGHPEIIWDK